MSNHDFKVGGIYVNRKYAYEVLEIDEPEGVLFIRRLDDDEILSVDLATQQRILENMALEQREEILEQARRIERDVSGYGKKNTGLSEADFGVGGHIMAREEHAGGRGGAGTHPI